KATNLTAVEKKGKRIRFTDGGKAVMADTAGSAVTIGGAKAKASALKAGLTCDISYLGNGDNARSIACR
ncbi:MAG TPA: hypothetical protein VFO61_04170, partial [Alphaproteobacteria bacterium]|nr:hypothetical protein [Alphaproteobacteria bacterium]